MLGGGGGGGGDYGLHDEAHVFVQSDENTWIEQAKLTPSYGYHVSFGRAVATSDDTIVVGAPGSNEPDESGRNPGGVVYVFTRHGDSWSEQAELLDSNAASLGGFGRSVAISGETIAVGGYRACVECTPQKDEDSVQLFTRSEGSWSRLAELKGSDLTERNTATSFGFDIAFSGETLVVGDATSDLSGISQAGSVYIFDLSGVVPTSKEETITTNFSDEEVQFDQGALDSGGGVFDYLLVLLVVFRLANRWMQKSASRIVTSDSVV